MIEKRSHPPIWPNVVRFGGIYLGAMLIGNLVWEVLQLPLYTIWQDGTPWQRIIAVVHCTLGDVLIAVSALLLSLLIVGSREWPGHYFMPVAIIATVIGLGYTVFSEWRNAHVLGSWSYSQLMPVISIGDARIGLSPLLQWVLLPALSFLITRRSCVYRELHPH